MLHHRQELHLLDEVDLVEDGEALGLGVAEHVDDVLVAAAERLAGVPDHGHDVGLGHRGADVVHHPDVELVQRLVDAGGVEEGDLAALGIVEDADDAVTRRLRLGRDDGDFVSEDAVQQRRLAGVRAADDGHDARFRGG